MTRQNAEGCDEMPDREKTIERLAERIVTCQQFGGSDVTIGWKLADDILALLKEHEVVVRCKDCKYMGSPDGYVMFCKHIHKFVDENWHCGDGEKE